MKKLLFVFQLIIIIGCKNHQSINTTVDFNDIPDSGLILKQWQVLGPFPSAGKINYLDNDNLDLFGYNESTVTFNNFTNISASKAHAGTQLSDRFRNVSVNSLFPVIDINAVFRYKIDSTISGNAYLACIIKSNKERNLRLNFSSDNGAKVWLNNILILKYDKELSVFSYENYLSVKLRKGSNFIMVKVYNSTSDWLMYARLEKETKQGLSSHQKLLCILNNHNFLKRSIIDSVPCLEANDKLPLSKYKVFISDENNNLVFNDTVYVRKGWKKDISFLNDGFYLTKLVLSCDTLEQFLYKGDIIGKIKEIIGYTEKLNLTLKVKNNLAANVYRFNHLLKPKSKGANFSEKQAWQRKIIYLYREIKTIYSNIIQNKEPLNEVPGFHIRTYVSEIDNQVQYYIVHIPKNYLKDKSFPIVFYIPYKLSYNYHYLESMRVANIDLIENLQDMSDKYSAIVVEPFSREVGRHNFNCIEETDFFEVFKTVKEDYNIDTNRLYLIGSCAGAHNAMNLAVKYPDLFAGIAFISPSFTEPYGYKIKNQWIEQNEPLNYIRNVSNIPILIVHSKLDEHVPISISDDFMALYKTNGLSNIVYKRLDDVIDQYYWSEYSDDLFNFLIKRKNASCPIEINLSAIQLKYCKAYWLKVNQFNVREKVEIYAKLKKNNVLNISSKNVLSYTIDLSKLPFNKNKELKIIENNKIIYTGKPKEKELQFNKVKNNENLIKTSEIEGPFAHVLIHKFIVVIGHTGTSNENTKLENLADTLNAMWKYKYWNDCIVKYDYEITPNDIQNANLILLGNYNSNKLLKRMKNKLPLKIAKEGISLKGNDTIKGEYLGFYMVYPNPLNKNKYIAIIGYNNPKSISLGNADLYKEDYKGLSKWLQLKYMEISCYGWFDYKIWDNKNKKTINNGYFNSYWN